MRTYLKTMRRLSLAQKLLSGLRVLATLRMAWTVLQTIRHDRKQKGI